MSKTTLPKMEEFDLAQIAAAALAARGIKQGLWRLAMRLNFAGLTSEWKAGDESGPGFRLPTGLVGISGLALIPATEPDDLVFDAAKVNAPTKQSRLAKGSAAGSSTAKARSKSS